jgi:hypothetical protein
LKHPLHIAPAFFAFGIEIKSSKKASSCPAQDFLKCIIRTFEGIKQHHQGHKTLFWDIVKDVYPLALGGALFGNNAGSS